MVLAARFSIYLSIYRLCTTSVKGRSLYIYARAMQSAAMAVAVAHGLPLVPPGRIHMYVEGACDADVPGAPGVTLGSGVGPASLSTVARRAGVRALRLPPDVGLCGQ